MVMSYLSSHDVFVTSPLVCRSWYVGTRRDLLWMPPIITTMQPFIIPSDLLKMYHEHIQSLTLNHNSYTERLKTVSLPKLRRLKLPYLPTTQFTYPLHRLREFELANCLTLKRTACQRLSQSTRILKLCRLTHAQLTHTICPYTYLHTRSLRLARFGGFFSGDVWLRLSVSFPALRILSLSHCCTIPDMDTTGRWKNLSVICLTDTSITTVGLIRLLSTTAGRLTHLKLHNNRSLDIRQLTPILHALCPLLQTLDIDPYAIPLLQSCNVKWRFGRKRFVRFVKHVY